MYPIYPTDLTYKDINSHFFNGTTFAELLYRLLVSEASLEGILLSNVHLCPIPKRDGGIDGIVEGVEKDSAHIKCPISIYQAKAKNYNKPDIKETLDPFPRITDIEERKKLIKINMFGNRELLYEYFVKGASYIWFYKDTLTDTKIKEIIKDTASYITENYGIDFSGDRVQVFDATAIATWCNNDLVAKQYVNHLIIGRNCSYEYFSPFIFWSEYYKSTVMSLDTYGTADYFTEKKESLNNLLIGKGKKICIIFGLSALGKTRFIHNVLSDIIVKATEEKAMNEGEIEDKDMKAANTLLFAHRVVYLSLKEEQESRGWIKRELVNMLTINSQYIFIADDCDSINGGELIDQFMNITHDNKLILLSTDIDFVRQRQIEKIAFTPDECKPLVRDYLSKHSIDPETKKYIEDCSSGFIFYAVLMFESLNQLGMRPIEENILSVGNYSSKKIIEAIYGRDQEEAIAVLQVCSIFSNVLFDNEFFVGGHSVNANQVKDLAEKITEFRIRPSNPESVFRKVCKKAIDHGILEKKGRYVLLRPRPLAFYLAWDYFKNVSDMSNLIVSIVEVGLIEQFCKQIRHFKGLPQTDTLIEVLLKRGYDALSPRNTLFSEQGARVFRSLCEVHPALCLEVLYKSFKKKSDRFLLGFEEGRRQIIYALEKLVFCNMYFEKAVSILFRLAVNENENWSNNANGVLSQLFHIHLPGTEVSLETRMKIIDKLYKTNTNEKSQLVLLKVLRQSLRTSHFSRMAGSELLGFESPKTDYDPKDRAEVLGYLKNNMLVLKDIRKDNRKLLKGKATDTIVESIDDLILYGCWFLFLAVFKDEEWDLKDCIRIQKTLTNAIQFRYFRSIEEEYLAKKYEESLFEDSTIRDLVNIAVVPGYNSDLNTIRTEIDSLIVRLVDQRIDIVPYIEVLFDESAREAFYFGHKLAKKYADHSGLLKRAYEILKTEEKQNISFLLGFLKGLRLVSKADFYDNVLGDSSFHEYVFRILSQTEAPLAYIMKLFSIVDKTPDLVIEFAKFTFGGALNHLSDDERLVLFEKLMTYGILGKQLVAQCIDTDAFVRKEIYDKYFSIVKEILLDETNLTPTQFLSQYIYSWSDLWIKLLKVEPKLASKLVKILLGVYKKNRDKINFATYCSNVFELLNERYFEEFWPRFSKLLLTKDFLLRMYIKTDFGWLAGNTYRNPLIGKHHIEKIAKWSQKKGIEGASAIIEIIALYTTDDDEIRWTKIALSIIKQNWQSAEFRDSLFSNLGSYMWVGSGAKYIDLQIKLMEQLKEINEISDKDWIDERINELESSRKRKQIREEEQFLDI